MLKVISSSLVNAFHMKTNLHLDIFVCLPWSSYLHFRGRSGTVDWSCLQPADRIWAVMRYPNWTSQEIPNIDNYSRVDKLFTFQCDQTILDPIYITSTELSNHYTCFKCINCILDLNYRKSYTTRDLRAGEVRVLKLEPQINIVGDSNDFIELKRIFHLHDKHKWKEWL